MSSSDRWLRHIDSREVFLHAFHELFARKLPLPKALFHSQRLGSHITGAIFISGEHDDRQILPLGESSNACQKRQPIDLRHHLVENDQVRLVLFQPHQSFRTIVRSIGLMTPSLQEPCCCFPAYRHVLDN